MKPSQSIKPISYFKAHAAEVVRSVSEDGRPLVITQNGEAKAILLDVREYERMQDTLALLKLLSQGVKEADEGREHPLQDVLAELTAKYVK
jgi:prevent-host-death family protein